MEEAGIAGVTGLLEYPRLRHTEQVLLSDHDRGELETIVTAIEKIKSSEECPPRVKLGICKNCSYYDFCYSGEE